MSKTLNERIKIFESLLSTIEKGIKNEKLRHVLLSYAEDNKSKLLTQKASKQHHDYPGGLMVHTVSVMNLALKLVKDYDLSEVVDTDVIMAGAIFHDAGKLVNRKTDVRLLEHTVLGVRLVSKYFDATFDRANYFDCAVREQVEHCIYTHMSPIKKDGPEEIRTVEAFLIHMADSLDGYMEPLQNDALKELEGHHKFTTNLPRPMVKSVQLNIDKEEWDY